LCTDHLFVYGTLRRGLNNRFARLLSEHAQFLSGARVPGRLYDFGRYPGAISSDQPEQWVHGEVHLLQEPSLLASLDEYEGSDFKRGMALAHLQEQTIDCWVYWYVGPVTGRLIVSGDWLKRQLRK
jgi:gamma-glutamylcyclotransferase (GGCT)/AIG2-like uncharacterized protein YtfP